MIATCANPSCVAEFRYFRPGGRLVVMDVRREANSLEKRRTLLWLCESCAPDYEIVILGGQPTCVRRAPAQRVG